MTKMEIKFLEFMERGRKITSREEFERWDWEYITKFKRKLKDNMPIKWYLDYSRLYNEKKEELRRTHK